jgi:hypothetical protein
LLNLTTTALGLTLIINGIHAGFAVTLHFLTLPFNIFLLTVLNRAPERNTLIMAIAVGWFGVMMLI